MGLSGSTHAAQILAGRTPIEIIRQPLPRPRTTFSIAADARCKYAITFIFIAEMLHSLRQRQAQLSTIWCAVDFGTSPARACITISAQRQAARAACHQLNGIADKFETTATIYRPRGLGILPSTRREETSAWSRDFARRLPRRHAATRAAVKSRQGGLESFSLAIAISLQGRVNDSRRWSTYHYFRPADEFTLRNAELLLYVPGICRFLLLFSTI